jgi:hypothetical protein
MKKGVSDQIDLGPNVRAKKKEMIMSFEQEQMDDLIDAIRRIAHGGVSGPTGLEALTMALCGSGLFGGSPGFRYGRLPTCPMGGAAT